MLIQGQELSEVVGVACREEQGKRRAVAREDFVVHQLVRDALSLALLCCLTKRQRIRLSEEVRHQLVVVGDRLAAIALVDRILRSRKPDELRRDGAALVHQLVERVLSVRAGLSKVDGTGANGDLFTAHRDALAIALHVQLLDVRHEAGEGLAIGQHRATLVVQDACVPHRQQAHDQRHVLLRRRVEEVLVHITASLVELHDEVEAVLQGQWQHPNSAPAREAATHPIPEAEDVVGVDAEGCSLVEGGGARSDVLCDTVRTAQALDQPILHGPRVEHRLRGGEGFRHDQHQSRLRVQSLRGSGNINGVHVCQEAQSPALGELRALRGCLQRFEDKLDTKV
mmetsp:Transcript_93745/g.242687  ORF Transcript_93745/g.242687 Transcript_93745/m.242687 type:complete len:340 (-) Transcript_93745:557-1576(-)